MKGILVCSLLSRDHRAIRVIMLFTFEHPPDSVGWYGLACRIHNKNLIDVHTLMMPIGRIRVSLSDIIQIVAAWPHPLRLWCAYSPDKLFQCRHPLQYTFRCCFQWSLDSLYWICRVLYHEPESRIVSYWNQSLSHYNSVSIFARLNSDLGWPTGISWGFVVCPHPFWIWYGRWSPLGRIRWSIHTLPMLVWVRCRLQVLRLAFMLPLSSRICFLSAAEGSKPVTTLFSGVCRSRWNQRLSYLWYSR